MSGIVRDVTTVEILHYYNNLIREKRKSYSSTNINSKTYQRNKKIFKKLLDLLSDKNIPPKEFILVQFKAKGYRPYPSQLLSKEAFKRWDIWKPNKDIPTLHKIQEDYLKKLTGSGYSIEEALSLDCFYYYFRVLKLKDVPELWKLLASKEIELIPELKQFMKGDSYGH